MGSGTHYGVGAVRLTKRQQQRIIEPKHIGGEWYANIDPDTGVIQWIRKKIKRKR